jgi:hypothetical protein
LHYLPFEAWELVPFCLGFGFCDLGFTADLQDHVALHYLPLKLGSWFRGAWGLELGIWDLLPRQRQCPWPKII